MEGVTEEIVPPVEVVPALVVGVTEFEELLGREVVGVLFEDDVEPLLDVPMLISKEHEPNKRVRKIKKGKLEKEIAQTCENAKKKLHRLEDQLRSVDKDIKEFKEIFSEFGQENKDIAIAGILSIQYGNTCEMLYAGMDERFKKFMP